MLKWQIDKSIVNDNKKQLTSEVHGLIFIPSFATVNEKKKSPQMFLPLVSFSMQFLP